MTSTRYVITGDTVTILYVPVLMWRQ